MDVGRSSVNLVVYFVVATHLLEFNPVNTIKVLSGEFNLEITLYMYIKQRVTPLQIETT